MSAALRANAPDLGQGANQAGIPLHNGMSTGTATTTVTITAAEFAASDWQAGDVLLAHFVCTGNMTFTFPTGWTYRGSATNQQHVSTSMSVSQCTYVLTAADISGGVNWVFSIGTSESFFIGTMIAVHGVDTTSNDGVDVAADAAASDATTSYTVPTITPTAGTRFIVEGAGGRWNAANNGQTWSAPTGDTLAVTSASAGGTAVRQESSAISYLTANNVTANGSTTYGGGTFNANPSTALAFAGGFAIAFKVGSTTPTLNLSGARGAEARGVSRFGRLAQNILGRRGAHILAASRFGAISTNGSSVLALSGPRGATASADSRVGRLDVDYQEKPSGFLLADSRPGALTTNASVLAFTGPKTASALGAARFGTLTKDTTGRLSLHGPANLFLLADGRAGTLTTNTLQLVGARGAEAILDTRPSWLLEASTRAGVVTLRTENAAVVTLVEAQ